MKKKPFFQSQKVTGKRPTAWAAGSTPTEVKPPLAPEAVARRGVDYWREAEALVRKAAEQGRGKPAPTSA